LLFGKCLLRFGHMLARSGSVSQSKNSEIGSR
jgi:hypothetical protein